MITGCQLAKEDGILDEGKLIGVFITTEFLEILEYEGLFNTGITVSSGKELIIDNNIGRVYADRVVKTLTGESTGDTTEISEFIFPGLTGISYFSPVITDGHGTYVSSMSDEAISNGHLSIHSGDDRDSRTMEGTIFITSPPGMDHIFYFNPVYQDNDGKVYVTPGDAISMTGESAPGTAMSQTLDVVNTVTENGLIKTDSFSITVSINIMYAPVKYVISQMNADNELISWIGYEPGEITETMIPDKNTAYIIVEMHQYDETGTLVVTRELYGREDGGFETIFERPDGICIKHWTQLIW